MEVERQLQEAVMAELDLSEEISDEEPVSYTHLDVYKRQEWYSRNF